MILNGQKFGKIVIAPVLSMGMRPEWSTGTKNLISGDVKVTLEGTLLDLASSVISSAFGCFHVNAINKFMYDVGCHAIKESDMNWII